MRFPLHVISGGSPLHILYQNPSCTIHTYVYQGLYEWICELLIGTGTGIFCISSIHVNVCA